MSVYFDHDDNLCTALVIIRESYIYVRLCVSSDQAEDADQNEVESIREQIMQRGRESQSGPSGLHIVRGTWREVRTHVASIAYWTGKSSTQDAVARIGCTNFIASRNYLGFGDQKSGSLSMCVMPLAVETESWLMPAPQGILGYQINWGTSPHPTFYRSARATSTRYMRYRNHEGTSTVVLDKLPISIDWGI